MKSNSGQEENRSHLFYCRSTVPHLDKDQSACDNLSKPLTNKSSNKVEAGPFHSLSSIVLSFTPCSMANLFQLFLRHSYVYFIPFLSPSMANRKCTVLQTPTLSIVLLCLYGTFFFTPARFNPPFPTYNLFPLLQFKPYIVIRYFINCSMNTM